MACRTTTRFLIYIDGEFCLTEALFILALDNRLVSATTEVAGVVSGNLAFAYDPDGNRVQKTDNGTAINYLVDRNRDYAQVLAEIDASQTLIANYVYGDDLIKQRRAANDSYYHYDGLGSTRALTDGAAVVTDGYAYDAYGNLLDQVGATENDYLYTGEQFDGGLGQYYLRARNYDPAVGRFGQMDEWIGSSLDPLSLHKYLYARVDPNTFVDPSGYMFLASQIIGYEIQFDTGTRLKASSAAGAKTAFSNLLFGHPPGDWGIIGNFVINNMVNAVEDAIGIGLLSDGYKNKGAFGTKAHTQLKEKIGRYKPLPGVVVTAEVYRDREGKRAGDRAKGSLGIDVEVKYNGSFEFRVG